MSEGSRAVVTAHKSAVPSDMRRHCPPAVLPENVVRGRTGVGWRVVAPSERSGGAHTQRQAVCSRCKGRLVVCGVWQLADSKGTGHYDKSYSGETAAKLCADHIADCTGLWVWAKHHLSTARNTLGRNDRVGLLFSLAWSDVGKNPFHVNTINFYVDPGNGESGKFSSEMNTWEAIDAKLQFPLFLLKGMSWIHISALSSNGLNVANYINTTLVKLLSLSQHVTLLAKWE